MRRYNKVFIFFLVVSLVMSFTLEGFADDNIKTIVVGYEDYQGFIAEDDKGALTGYGVEQLKMIEKYSNLKFEFEPITWVDSLSQVKKKKIDLICSAKKTYAALGQYSFSEHPFGNTRGVCYTLPDQDDIYYEDYKGLDGKNLGFLKGGTNYSIFKEFAALHNFSFKPFFYDSDEDMVKALKDREVMAIATEHLVSHDDLKLIVNFDNRPFYLMSYSNNDFMAEINEAMSTILTENPHFQMELFDKYYGDDVAIKDPHLT